METQKEDPISIDKGLELRWTGRYGEDHHRKKKVQ